eukprot:TRINITY_DN1209_c0_g3_i2.p1 TRINITY_DN1209_c0_g3~~TRINITY_DN1209_c0_g3_i2.p1  ORF type:complete len:429 (-),score=121.70 TRINITY_DN1209_c0_g3_i2:97-1383(-)
MDEALYLLLLIVVVGAIRILLANRLPKVEKKIVPQPTVKESPLKKSNESNRNVVVESINTNTNDDTNNNNNNNNNGTITNNNDPLKTPETSPIKPTSANRGLGSPIESSPQNSLNDSISEDEDIRIEIENEGEHLEEVKKESIKTIHPGLFSRAVLAYPEVVSTSNVQPLRPKIVTDPSSPIGTPSNLRWRGSISTMLCNALKENKMEKVRGIINSTKETGELAAHVNDAQEWFGQTALHLACSNGSLDVIQILLEQGADVNKQDDNGNTPLHAAVGDGNIECCRLLLDAKADINVQEKMHGDTPLHKVVAPDDFEDLCQLFIKRGAIVDIKNNVGATPLMKAAEAGSIGCMDKLLAAGADCKLQDNSGNTAMHRAVLCSSAVEAASLLLQYGAESEIENKAGETPKAIVESKHAGTKQLTEIISNSK